MIEIVIAQEAHIPAVLSIENASISPPWSEGALLNEVGRDDGLFTLAVENGAVLGFLILRRVADEAELYQIAIHEDARRRGVADILMNTAKEYCRKNNILSIYLEVRKSNEPAIRLYKKHGFKNEGRRKNYYSSPVEDAIVMAGFLAADTKDF